MGLGSMFGGLGGNTASTMEGVQDEMQEGKGFTALTNKKTQSV